MDIMVLDNALDIACELLFDMSTPYLKTQREIEEQKALGVSNFRQEVIRKAHCRMAGITEETPPTERQKLIIAEMNEYAREVQGNERE